MYKKKRVLAVIPARGGSKRVPRKNIRLLGEKPLIAWTIDEALKSKHLDDVVLSTDDTEIIDIAKKLGATVPFVRPAHLSTDDATSYSVLEHALQHLQEKEGKTYDYIMMLQPTSPLRRVEDIDGALRKIVDLEANSVVTVCEAEYHPLRSNELPEDLSMNNFLRPEAKDKTIQELPIHYRLNGAVHVASVKEFLAQKTFFPKDGVYAYIMPQTRSADIDTLLDFLVAETLLKEGLHEI